MSSSATTSRDDRTLFAPLDRLADQLSGMGLSLAVFDAAGESVLSCIDSGEVCQRICGSGGPCRPPRDDGLKQVWSDGTPRVLDGPAGCVIMAVPVLRRRRMVAVAMACYLTPDTADREEFARTCDQLHLDRSYMATLVEAGITHPATEAPYWMKVIHVLLSQALENSVARNELASFSSNLSTTYEELSLLYRLSGAMKVNVTPEDFFDHVCEELLEVMHVSATTAILNARKESNRTDWVVRAGDIPLSDSQLRRLASLNRSIAMTLLRVGGGHPTPQVSAE